MIKDYYTVTTDEFLTGNLPEFYLKRAITRNKEPKFNGDDKYYNLIKVLKSNTVVIPWLIKIHGKHYVALYNFMNRIDYCVSFFQADSRGRYDIFNPLCIYRGYVDLESACDRFAVEYIAMEINNNNEQIINILKSEVNNINEL